MQKGGLQGEGGEGAWGLACLPPKRAIDDVSIDVVALESFFDGGCAHERVAAPRERRRIFSESSAPGRARTEGGKHTPAAAPV